MLTNKSGLRRTLIRIVVREISSNITRNSQTRGCQTLRLVGMRRLGLFHRTSSLTISSLSLLCLSIIAKDTTGRIRINIFTSHFSPILTRHNRRRQSLRPTGAPRCQHRCRSTRRRLISSSSINHLINKPTQASQTWAIYFHKWEWEWMALWTQIQMTSPWSRIWCCRIWRIKRDKSIKGQPWHPMLEMLLRVTTVTHKSSRSTCLSLFFHVEMKTDRTPRALMSMIGHMRSKLWRKWMKIASRTFLLDKNNFGNLYFGITCSMKKLQISVFTESRISCIKDYISKSRPTNYCTFCIWRAMPSLSRVITLRLSLSSIAKTDSTDPWSWLSIWAGLRTIWMVFLFQTCNSFSPWIKVSKPRTRKMTLYSIVYLKQHRWKRSWIRYTRTWRRSPSTCLGTNHAGVQTRRTLMIQRAVSTLIICETFEGLLRSSSMFLKIANTCRAKRTAPTLAGSNALKACSATNVIRRWSGCTTPTNTKESTVIAQDATKVRYVHSIILNRSEITLRKYARTIASKCKIRNTISK